MQFIKRKAKAHKRKHCARLIALGLKLSSFYGGFSKGVHLFPYRTEKLSPLWPMVLHHNAGE